MHFALATTAALGFPNPNTTQLVTIQEKADGTLPSAPPLPQFNPASVPVFQVIAFNEEFEVAFFQSLIHNITHDVEGFRLESRQDKRELLDVLESQEELHAIAALKTLENFNAFAPPPCQYRFPTTNIADAISLAETFTTLVLGTLQDASQALAKNGDDGAVRSVASIIGQEGQQSGFYRTLLSQKPSEKPFLTTSVATFAFSAMQQFIVPNSCPFPLSDIPLPIFPALAVQTGSGGSDVEPRDQDITFTADLSGIAAAQQFVNGTGAGLFITYFTGQNIVSVPVTNVSWKGNVVTLDAEFPFTANVMSGLTLTTTDTFSDTQDAVPNFTMAAPGLVQVNDWCTSNQYPIQIVIH
ncbi:hypothetical protein B0H63DRAFT_503733 [Podospora didyma]|uniref:Sexual development protein n=1 Tax=Podospora didyma TaxID=330526 RepID=A0AAE0KA80_9PEZI|nr:hypothetical protein B0H63DRAFT_503733 [Podospora didyma]